MASYEVRLSRSARLELARIGSKDDRRRLRVGDYRVVYEVLDRSLVVDVIKVGHRRDVYR